MRGLIGQAHARSGEHRHRRQRIHPVTRTTRRSEPARWKNLVAPGPTIHLLALPITLLVLFAPGILLIDFMLPKEMKWLNAVTVFIGMRLLLRGRRFMWGKIQLFLGAEPGKVGMLGTMVVDRGFCLPVYFFICFWRAPPIAILASSVGAVSRNRKTKTTASTMP